MTLQILIDDTLYFVRTKYRAGLG